MADWSGTSRSNYFRVKSVAEFKAFLSDYEAQFIEDSEGRVGFYSTTYDGGLPVRWDDQSDDYINLIDHVHEYLVENQVCVVMEAGAEKARYISGCAIAITWTGERTSLSLSDIYMQAYHEFGDDAEITEAIY